MPETKTFMVTNKGKEPRVLPDANGRAISFAPGQMRSEVELPIEYARKLHGRGGAWNISGSLGGDASFGSRGKRAQVDGENGEPDDTTVAQKARALIEQAETMDFQTFREAAVGIIGSPLPRSKDAIVEKLEEVAGPAPEA